MRLALLFCLAVLLGGCIVINSKPPDSADFDQIKTVHDLEGVYQNLGETGEDEGEPYLRLSSLIWGNTAGLDHSTIEAIEVRALSDNSLVVRAHTKNGVIKEDTFVEGKDFELRSGRIRLRQGVGIAGFTGEPIMGPYYENVELGLDKKGHGKFKNQAAGAGMVFLFWPIAFGMNEEVRFVRIGK